MWKVYISSILLVAVNIGALILFNYMRQPPVIDWENYREEVANNIKEEQKLDVRDGNLQLLNDIDNQTEYSNGIFSISFPNDVFPTYNDKIFNPVGVGFMTSRAGDFIWSVAGYSKNVTSREEQVAQIGSQFSDRIEELDFINIQGLEATLVTVTTATRPNWKAQNVIIDGEQAGYPNLLFVISNGASDIEGFETFYNSFNLVRK